MDIDRVTDPAAIVTEGQKLKVKVLKTDWEDERVSVSLKALMKDPWSTVEKQFPVGTKLTVAIIPDAGYQLVSFGINGGEFEPQEEIGTYTFEVEGGPFHLQAEIAQVEDVVKSKTNKVSSGTISLGGEEDAMSVGTARLDVEDTDLTSNQISNFEEDSNFKFCHL